MIEVVKELKAMMAAVESPKVEEGESPMNNIDELKMKATVTALEVGIDLVPDGMAEDVEASRIAHGVLTALTGMLKATPEGMTEELAAKIFGAMTMDMLTAGTEKLKKEMESRV